MRATLLCLLHLLLSIVTLVGVESSSYRLIEPCLQRALRLSFPKSHTRRMLSGCESVEFSSALVAWNQYLLNLIAAPARIVIVLQQ
jgi:hypothetical protein